jgi:PEP-CTERM motif
LTLRFNALDVSAATVVALDIGSSQFGDAFGNTLNMSFQAARAQIEVTGGGSVPEPSALALALMALVGAGAAKRRSGRQVVGGLAAALVLSGVAMAQLTPQTPSVAAGATEIDAVVVKVQGMRLQLRTADGREFWVSVKANVGAEMVGKRLTGQAIARGDTYLVSNPAYTRVP